MTLAQSDASWQVDPDPSDSRVESSNMYPQENVSKSVTPTIEMAAQKVIVRVR